MYRPGRIPLDASNLAAYLQNELQVLAGEINGTRTKEYQPVWTGAGGNPALGNGQLSARFISGNDTTELWFRLVVGSTTTFGSGAWDFSLPEKAKAFAQYGEAFMLDSGTNRFAGACEVSAAGPLLRVYAHGSLNPVQSNVPFTWATGDELHAHIRYLR